ncbi:MAG: major capsid protein [Cetobacterium sp.]
MSGAVFNIISSTGQTDKLLYANDFLSRRINSFITEREPRIKEKDVLSLPDDNKYFNIERSVLPSLNEIEKSHSTFVNGSFKPSIMIASEYIKVPKSNPTFGSSVMYQLPQVGHFTVDSVLHVRLSKLSAIDQRDRVRYVTMLGHRLIKHVKFLSQEGSIIDEYGTDDYNAYYQYEFPGNHRSGYLASIGQELPTMGTLTPDPTSDVLQEYRLIGDGNQTLKQFHDPIDLFVPLLFWFKDIKTAMPRLPWGKLQIEVTFADVQDIVAFYDGGGGGSYNPPKMEFCDLYVNQLFTSPEIFSIFAKKFVFSIIRTHRAHKQVIAATTDKSYQVLLNNLKWPTEVIYLSFRPRENLGISQYWDKMCKLSKKTYKVPVVAKDPLSVIYVTALASPAPTANSIVIASTQPLSTIDDKYVDYDLLITSGKGFKDDIRLNKYTVKSYNATTKLLTINEIWVELYPDTTTTFELFTPKLAIGKVVYYSSTPVVDKLALKVHDIYIFKSMVSKFYNTYLPLKFDDASTPEDCGWYMFPFCTKLYSHNPSGTLNISLMKELYLEFDSSYITRDYPVDLLCLARCINFLLIDQNVGGLSLRYYT